MDIAEYVEFQMETFDVVKFNPVDSLVLSQFSYFNFNVVFPESSKNIEPVRIGDLLKAENIPGMLAYVQNRKKNRRLLVALGMSPRFRDIRMCFYSDDIDLDEEMQFAAVTYLLDDETAYVAYRGTDLTLVGWKEDFNMAFISPIPAQEEGVSYLNAVGNNLLSQQLIVGGHSKGGNIAVYSAMNCNEDIKDRILTIYTHDGPGFRKEVFTSKEFAEISARIGKTLPQSSLVGILLHHQENYSVVKSRNFWIMQHDPFSWEINKRGHFIYTKDITEGAEHINITINQWLSSLDAEKRELFVTTLYDVFETAGIVSFSDFSKGWYKKARRAIDALKDVDPEVKSFLNKTIKSLISLYIKNINFPFERS